MLYPSAALMDSALLVQTLSRVKMSNHGQLNKMEEKAFEMFPHHIDDHKMKKWLSVARGIDSN